jgi:hypothetical protein
MDKVVVIVTLEDNKILNVNGPFETDRQLMVQMLEEAVKVTKYWKQEGKILLADNAMITGLATNKINHRLVKHL